MARSISIAWTDDLDGSDAAETLHFGLDGLHYEIDLNGEHAHALRQALSTFVEHARRVPTESIEPSQAASPTRLGRRAGTSKRIATIEEIEAIKQSRR